ncbi:MAG: ECF transporter S component [Streptococcaceae bacterium]|nr:ECF transporter S component [Streptococcaceae bacterium]
MKSSIKIRQLVYLAILSSFVIVLGIIIKIQTPVGIFTPMCDAGVFVTALFFGPSSGLVVGAFSGFLIDFLSGAYEWMFFSLIIHALQGFIVGWSLKKNFLSKRNSHVYHFILGSLMMVAGYALSGNFLYGWTLSIAQVPNNIIQTGLGIVIAIIVENIIRKIFQKIRINKELK